MFSLRRLIPIVLVFLPGSLSHSRAEDPRWLDLPGRQSTDLPGLGKRVVLISGDEEYRSEEALPLLAQILSEQHGFDCKVLFAINPETNTIDPNYSSNIPGLEHLDQADFMVMFLRFRSLPDEQMQHIDRFVQAGKPFLAIRTSTHPFNFGGDAKTSYAEWSWNNGTWPGGFGQQIIGETWVSHHGVHNGQATRGVINPKHADSPLLNSVTDVFGPTDVYGVTHLPESAHVLMYGQVLSGMKPDDPPLPGEKNEPMMPLIWTRNYQMPGGKEGKVIGSTIGAAVDLLSEDLRRLFVNSVYWGVGLPVPSKARVAIPADYQASYFGFKPKDFFTKQNLTPEDMRVGSGLPSEGRSERSASPEVLNSDGSSTASTDRCQEIPNIQPSGTSFRHGHPTMGRFQGFPRRDAIQRESRFRRWKLRP